MAERSLDFNPNFAQAWGIKGYLSALLGDLPVGRHDGSGNQTKPVRAGTRDCVPKSLLTVSVAADNLRGESRLGKKLVALNPTDIYGLLRLHDPALLNGDADEANSMLVRINGRT